MTKIVLETLASIQNDPTAVDTINDNSAVIVSAMDNTLSRNGETPNQMESNFDMNGFRIIGLPRPMYDNEPARLKDIGNAYQYAQDAAASAAAAEADRVLADADVVLTHADVVLTHADVVTTHADVVSADASKNAAAASAAAALVSENNAATSATNSSNSASAASASASTATTQATNAGNSATAAATSATNAATSETNAGNSATSAAGSASTATTQAGIATTQAGLASGSASAAATSETNAAASASAAATSETNAATSETNAASSASAASTSASNAATSETNAGTSETNAAASASAASTSATNAATSETNAANSLSDFQAEYLGPLASDPVVSHPTGTLYWNTTTSALMIYDGSSWVSYNPSTGAVSSVFGRTGAVVSATNDYNFNQLAGNIATTQMNSGTGASSSTYWRGDGTWSSPAGGVTSVFGRTGAVVAASNDYSYAQLSGKPTIREALTANRTYYVATTGSNSNDGLTVGTPFLTIQKAVDVLIGTLDFAGFSVTIQIADGTYSAGAGFTGPWTGGGTVTIQGNNTTPGNVLLSCSANVFQNTGVLPGVLLIKDLELTTTVGIGIYNVGLGTINFSNINFGSVPTNQPHLDTGSKGAKIQATGSYKIKGGAGWHMLSLRGEIIVDALTVTITGTPAFSSAFCLSTRLGYIESTGVTWSGSATGARYSVDTNSVIQTLGSGTSYFPGNAAGVTSTGGQYI